MYLRVQSHSSICWLKSGLQLSDCFQQLSGHAASMEACVSICSAKPGNCVGFWGLFGLVWGFFVVSYSIRTALWIVSCEPWALPRPKRGDGNMQAGGEREKGWYLTQFWLGVSRAERKLHPKQIMMHSWRWLMGVQRAISLFAALHGRGVRLFL